MGDPKKSRRTFETPKRLWDKSRIMEEKNLAEKYGLSNKKEIWKTKSKLKGKRQNARKLLALPLERRLKREKELMESLYNQGFLEKNASLEDVLTLSVESFLERRLQTIVWRNALANTPKQARQFITHGRIGITGKKITAPSHFVTREEEPKIAFYGKPIKLEHKPKEKLKKEFEEAKPKEEKIGEKTEKDEEKKEKVEISKKIQGEKKEEETKEKGKPEEKAEKDKGAEEEKKGEMIKEVARNE